jgi:hypothetical protein
MNRNIFYIIGVIVVIVIVLKGPRAILRIAIANGAPINCLIFRAGHGSTPVAKQRSIPQPCGVISMSVRPGRTGKSLLFEVARWAEQLQRFASCP